MNTRSEEVLRGREGKYWLMEGQALQGSPQILQDIESQRGIQPYQAETRVCITWLNIRGVGLRA